MTDKINNIHTPGHADFGGSRACFKMVDGVLLLVDALKVNASTSL